MSVDVWLHLCSQQQTARLCGSAQICTFVHSKGHFNSGQWLPQPSSMVLGGFPQWCAVFGVLQIPDQGMGSLYWSEKWECNCAGGASCSFVLLLIQVQSRQSQTHPCCNPPATAVAAYIREQVPRHTDAVHQSPAPVIIASSSRLCRRHIPMVFSARTHCRRAFSPGRTL